MNAFCCVLSNAIVLLLWAASGRCPEGRELGSWPALVAVPYPLALCCTHYVLQYPYTTTHCTFYHGWKHWVKLNSGLRPRLTLPSVLSWAWFGTLIQYTLHTAHCTMHTAHWYNTHFTLQIAVHTSHCTAFYSPNCNLHIAHCLLHNSLYALHHRVRKYQLCKLISYLFDENYNCHCAKTSTTFFSSPLAI